MSYVYTETMLFLNSEDDQPEGWTTDCGGKRDYDPVIVRISSRVYRDGSYLQSVYLGGDCEIHKTPIVYCSSAAAAMAEVEQKAREHADKIIAAVKAAYGR